MRWLAALLMLVWASAQPPAGSALLVSALAIALHGSDHAHAVSLVPDEGHTHVVLSHVEGDSHEHGEAPRHDESKTSFSEADHVFHLTGGDAANATARRVTLDILPPLAIAVAVPFASAPTWILRASRDPSSRIPDQLRAVVLRL